MSRILRSFSPFALAFLLLTACDGEFVGPPPPLEVITELFSLAPEGLTMEIGETLAVTVTLVRSNGQQVNSNALQWVSTNSATASVDPDGVVSAHAPGQTQIVASSGQLADTTDIVVVNLGEDKSGLVITPDEMALDWLGASVDAKAKLYDADGTLVATPDLEWTSADQEVVTVDQMGKVIAQGVGGVLVVAAAVCCDRADTAHAEVRQVVSTVAVSSSSITLEEVGDSLQLSATPKDQGGSTVEDASLEWSSSNTTVASVSRAGLVTAMADGQAILTASSGGTSATVAVRVGAATAGVAELPRAQVDTDWPGYNRIVDVPSGASIQAALNDAQPGDFIRLADGATYYEQITLPARTQGAPILIGSLPAEGRAAPGRGLPKIVGRDMASRVIYAGPGARDYRLVGLEAQYQGVDKANAVIQIDHADGIVLDRVVAGGEHMELQRAVILHGTNLAVVDSWLMAGYNGADSQAILSYSGQGPYHIEGNYLAGAGENVMFGGSTPKSGEGMPQDITIRSNHFHKPEAWRDGRYTVKNLFEIKFAARVLLENNVFEGNWKDGQDGHAFNIKLSAYGEGDRVEDVTLRHNVLRRSDHGIKIVSPATRVVVANNLLLAGERAFTLLYGHTDVQLLNNTVRHSGNIITSQTNSGSPASGFVARGNIWGSSAGYGVKGGGAEGTATLDADFAGWVYENNGHIGREADRYPAANLFVDTEAEVGFDAQWRLSTSSPFAGLGADIDSILALTAGVVQ